MKKAEKFEVGKAIASNSDGRIALAIEDGVAVLRGEFTRAERKPLRFKKGAGWRYKMVDGVETWSLRVEPKAKEPEPKQPSTAKNDKPSGKRRYDELPNSCVGRLYHEGIGIRFAKSTGRVTVGIKTERGISTTTARVFEADKDGYMSWDEYNRALDYVRELDALIIATLKHIK